MRTLIATERLVLKETTLEEKEEMFQLHSDPDVQRLTGESTIGSMEEMERAISKRRNDYKKYGFGRLSVFLKETHEFIGWAGLLYLPEFDKVDIGYRFKKEYWGNGYATEAARAIIDHGFNVLGLDLIIAIALPENKASIRIMEKVGMMFDKRAPYDEVIREAIWYKLDRSAYISR